MSFSLLEYARKCRVNEPENFVEKCGMLREFLVEANKVTNLTRITEEQDFNIKHAADSLGLPLCFPGAAGKKLRIADLGCGAGFPSLILALAFPEWQITSIDSTGKKIDFVRRAAAYLGLSNLEAVHGRVNELNRKMDFKYRFDIVTARAVATAPSLARDASEFPAEDGSFILYKTPGQAEEDMPLLKKNFRCFRWSVTDAYELPEDSGTRLFIVGKRVR